MRPSGWGGVLTGGAPINIFHTFASNPLQEGVFIKTILSSLCALLEACKRPRTSSRARVASICLQMCRRICRPRFVCTSHWESLLPFNCVFLFQHLLFFAATPPRDSSFFFFFCSRARVRASELASECRRAPGDRHQPPPQPPLVCSLYAGHLISPLASCALTSIPSLPLLLSLMGNLAMLA